MLKISKILKSSLYYLSILLVTAISLGTIICLKYDASTEILKIEKTKQLAGSILQIGDFISPSGHKITKTTEGILLYDDTYTLPLKTNARGNTISGKIGSNSKSISLYQLNKTTIVARGSTTYIHNSKNCELPGYSVFKAKSEITPVEDGII